MCRLIGRLAEIEPPSNPRLNKGIMELTDILSSPVSGRVRRAGPVHGHV